MKKTKQRSISSSQLRPSVFCFCFKSNNDHFVIYWRHFVNRKSILTHTLIQVAILVETMSPSLYLFYTATHLNWQIRIRYKTQLQIWFWVEQACLFWSPCIALHDQNLISKTEKRGFQSFLWHLDSSNFKILEPLQSCPAPHIATYTLHYK